MTSSKAPPIFNFYRAKIELSALLLPATDKMGQYYNAIILAERAEGEKEYIRGWFDPFSYGNGCKLMEHSYIGNKFVTAVEEVLRNGGTFYKTRLVWAGDYADEEPNEEIQAEPQNLYNLATEEKCFNAPNPYNADGIRYKREATTDMKVYRYIVNHTKRQYVDKQGTHIHPLPILTSDGNGRGGGDYRGPNKSLAGAWARNVISIEKDFPPGYLELHCRFDEEET